MVGYVSREWLEEERRGFPTDLPMVGYTARCKVGL